MSQGRKTTNRRPVWTRWMIGLAVAAAVAVGLAIARGGGGGPGRAELMAYTPYDGPLTLPLSVSTAPDDVRALYEFAARRSDVLRHLPCFCGCGREGHKSNYDCFVDDVREGGFVDIDEMGFT